MNARDDGLVVFMARQFASSSGLESVAAAATTKQTMMGVEAIGERAREREREPRKAFI